jgi:hypothetical protein
MSAILTSSITAAGASIGTNSVILDARDLVLAGDTLPVAQKRRMSVAEADAFGIELQNLRRARAVMYARKARQKGGPVDALFSVLYQASTYRSRTQFGDPSSMAKLSETLRLHVESGRVLHLALPLGGSKVANPAKVGSRFLPDASEWMALSLLAAMADALSQIHDPGAVIVLIPDALLHSDDLGMPTLEVLAHAHRIQLDLSLLGLADRVVVADTPAYLPENWIEEVDRLARTARARAGSDTPFAAAVNEQVRSLRFSLNQRVFAWPLEHAVLVNAALAGHSGGAPDDARLDAADLQRVAERIVYHYIGVNHALRTLDIPGRVVEALGGSRDHIRLTVHAKPGEPRPILADDGSRARPGLIPMHSVPLRYQDNDRPRLATLFELEALMSGHTEVLDHDGRFLYFEPSR